MMEVVISVPGLKDVSSRMYIQALVKGAWGELECCEWWGSGLVLQRGCSIYIPQQSYVQVEELTLWQLIRTKALRKLHYTVYFRCAATGLTPAHVPSCHLLFVEPTAVHRTSRLGPSPRPSVAACHKKSIAHPSTREDNTCRLEKKKVIVTINQPPILRGEQGMRGEAD